MPDQVALGPVGVLELVHQQLADARALPGADRLTRPEQLLRPEEKRVEGGDPLRP